MANIIPRSIFSNDKGVSTTGTSYDGPVTYNLT